MDPINKYKNLQNKKNDNREHGGVVERISFHPQKQFKV